MKNRFLSIIVLTAFNFLSAMSCLADDAVTNTTPTMPATSTTSTTSEKTTTQVQKLQPFKMINFSGLGNLHIKQSDHEEFTIEAEETILPLIKVYVKDGTLYINLKDASKHTQTKINYYLSIKDLNTINAFDTSNIVIQEPLETNELDISINNLGTADINVKVKKLTVNIGGGGKIDAHGIADSQEISISGAGEFNGNKLSGKEAVLNIKESGMVKVNVTDTLTANISGDGSVKYCGQPSVTRKISGKGSVEPLEDCRL